MVHITASEDRRDGTYHCLWGQGRWNISLLVRTGEMVHITASEDRRDGAYHC